MSIITFVEYHSVATYFSELAKNATINRQKQSKILPTFRCNLADRFQKWALEFAINCGQYSQRPKLLQATKSPIWSHLWIRPWTFMWPSYYLPHNRWRNPLPLLRSHWICWTSKVYTVGSFHTKATFHLLLQTFQVHLGSESQQRQRPLVTFRPHQVQLQRLRWWNSGHLPQGQTQSFPITLRRKCVPC